MTEQAARPSSEDREADPVHVFDQTNGVLGPDEDTERPPKSGTTPPTSFGVPPIVSL